MKRVEKPSADRFLQPVAHPEWLKRQIPQHIKTLDLALKGKIPEKLLGFMIVTSCRHMLRCVYGSDLEAVIALKDSLFADLDIFHRLVFEKKAKAVPIRRRRSA